MSPHDQVMLCLPPENYVTGKDAACFLDNIVTPMLMS